MSEQQETWHPPRYEVKLYLSWEVLKAIQLIAKAKSPSAGDAGKIVSRDEIADNMLREAIREHYPQFSEFQKTVDQLEKELLKTLGQ
jgi:hypothetical protein